LLNLRYDAGSGHPGLLKISAPTTGFKVMPT